MRRSARAIGLSTFLVLLFVVSSSNGMVGAATPPSASTPAGGSHTIPANAAPPSSALPSAPLPPPAAGRGTFFQTTSIPSSAPGFVPCYSGNCPVAADNPSMNLTSTGELVTAYTSYTNDAPCVAAQPYGMTEIGIVRSSNLGSTWSSPTYLGNPTCTSPTVSEYPSAWQPSLTSLSNGTLVLAYIEYNDSQNVTPPPHLGFGPSAWDVTFDRLVVTRSFNSGATWTTPLVVNSSANAGLNGAAFAPVRPSITAIGQTVYLSWMNLTEALGSGVAAGSSAVHLVVSTNGGASFGTPIDLATQGTAGISVAMNPSVLVPASGELYLGYATNLTYHATLGCIPSGCVYGFWTSSVVVATSTTNGSTFSYQTLATNVVVPPSRSGPFFDPSPTLAATRSGGQVYVAYSEGILEPDCYSYGYCYAAVGTEVGIQNSSTNGASWSPSHAVDPALVHGAPFGPNLAYNPSIAVASSGNVELEMTFDNYSVCQLGFYGNFCGPQAQIYLNSSDNGATFGSPIYLSDNSTQLLLNPNNPDGEYASIISAGADLFVAWTADVCPQWNGSFVYTVCLYPASGGSSAVQVSVLYNGPGVSLTFKESGLSTGTTWSVDVLGNVRQATAPTNLVLSGVPTSLNVTWNISVTAPYGVQFSASPSLVSPYIVSTATTVTIAYTLLYLLNVSTVPGIMSPTYPPSFCYVGMGVYWDDPVCPNINWNITPLPGPTWVTPGTSVTLNVTPVTVLYCNPSFVGGCYEDALMNFTFLSWKGTGAGSVNTTSTATTITVNGPLNETASFRADGWCYITFTPVSRYCTGSSGGVSFHESGLPSGTQWGVSVEAGGQFVSNQSTGAWLGISGSLTGELMNYTAWTVPGTTPGTLWVPTSTTPISPIELPTDPFVMINYTLVTASSQNFTAFVSTAGLPSTASWTYSIDSTSYASQNVSAPAITVTGGTHTLNGGPVVQTNLSRYTVQSIDTRELSGSGVWKNFTTFPASVTFNGNTFVFLNYTTQYWTTITASLGGNVSPSSEWVGIGGAVPLSAVALPGFHFVGWSGTGASSYTGSSASITIFPVNPTTELAAFAPNAPATWVVNFTETGLPAGTAYTVAFGNLSYTGTGTFQVLGLAPAVYDLSLPFVYVNGTDGVRYLPTLVNSTLGHSGAAFSVFSSGTISLSYSAQYLVTVGTTGGGTVSPSPGSAWTDAAATLDLTATPDAGQMFVAWNGTGAGSSSASTESITLVVVAPVVEIATFAPVPVVVAATFSLQVTETGLPSGVVWTAQIGGQGYSGSTASLSIPSLNGSYTVSVPTIEPTTGTRYVPATENQTVTVTAAGVQLSVAFAAEYLVTVNAGSGGTVTPGTQWVAAGTSLTLVASASSGMSFANWTGSGTGSVSAGTASVTVTVNAPMTESASFSPVYTVPTVSSGSSTDGQPVAIGLFVALLIVGLIVGILLLRRRAPPAAPVQDWSAPPEEAPAESAPWTEGGEAPPAEEPMSG